MSGALRETVKAAMRGLAAVAVVPALCSFYLRATLVGRDRALLSSTQALGLVPGLPGQYVRRAFLSRVLAHCASSAAIEWGASFSAVGARIDDHVYIGPNCHIGLVHLERDVLLAPAVQIPSGRLTHGVDDLDVPLRNQGGTPQCIRVGANSWIGGGAIVMADVGAATIVGAGAVVTRALPAGVVAAGVPARVIRERAGADAPDGGR